MTRKTKGIVVLSLICAFIVGLIVSIVLIVNKVTANPFEGTWVSASTSGSYTFYEDGSMKAHFGGEKVPVLETAFKGTVEGTYAYDKGEKEISITLKIYSKEITSLYTYEIEENTLILTDTETGKDKKYSLIVVDD